MIAPIPMNRFSGSELQQMIDVAKSNFRSGEGWFIQVPARLCLAADHTDYWEAFTPELVTFASDSCTMKALIAPRNDCPSHTLQLLKNL